MIKLTLLFMLAGQTGPTWNEELRPVPYPIPANICVEAHITDKGRKAGGEGKIKIFNAPQSMKDLQLLEEARGRGLAILKRCASTDL